MKMRSVNWQRGCSTRKHARPGMTCFTAVGEVVDNSIEAKARKHQKIHTNFVKGKTKEITEMAFSDDGGHARHPV